MSTSTESEFLRVTDDDTLLRRLGDDPPARAITALADACLLLGPTDLPDVPFPPENGRSLRERQLEFADRVLECAQLMAAARAEHPSELVQQKQVDLSQEDLRHWSKPIYDAVQAMTEGGVAEHAALGILMYAAGAIAGQMRVMLPGNLPLRQAVPPLFQGWERGRALLLAAQPPEQPKH